MINIYCDICDNEIIPGEYKKDSKLKIENRYNREFFDLTLLEKKWEHICDNCYNKINNLITKITRTL